MEFINYNAFILGVLSILSIYCVNLGYCLLCIAYNIKILEFSFFYQSGFRLHHKVVEGIQFTLGWIPMGGYVKPLGMTTDEEEKKEVSPQDLPYAFFNKPGYLKEVFISLPLIVILLFLVAALAIFSWSSPAVPGMGIYNYLITAIQAMFSGQAAREALAAQTLAMIAGNNVIVFAFILMQLAFLFFNIGPFIMNVITPPGKDVHGIRKVLVLLIMLFFLWIAVWKIPMLVFSFFPMSQNIIYVVSFSLGLFITGVVLYFLTIPAARLFPNPIHR